MNKYFNIFLEFDRNDFNNAIVSTIEKQGKGYVCVVDGNVLATSTKNEKYREIINGALVNSCDGSSIALMASRLHREKFNTYTGPEIFAHFVCSKYSQLFLGNTDEVLNKLQEKLKDNNEDISRFQFKSLPFQRVEEFDYNSIANYINTAKPDLVWISLGAPKQEWFAIRLFPLINSGVLICIGAAVNLHIGEGTIGRAPAWMRKMHLEWLYRVIIEPKKQWKKNFRYIIALPEIYFNERRMLRSSKTGRNTNT